MHPLSALELLDVWERGRDKNPVDQAILTLLAACPETSEEEILGLSIGERDKYLLILREWAFGSQFVGLASCPGCGENLELNFSTEDLLQKTDKSTHEMEPKINIDNFEISFRLPNSQDMLDLMDCMDISSAEQQLAKKCILESRHEGKEISTKQVPEYLLGTVANRMTELDPLADIQIELACPSCDFHWSVTFDIISYFWTEVNAWAYRVLSEVHTIASAYGWREVDILAMSPLRRQLYLEMIGK